MHTWVLIANFGTTLLLLIISSCGFVKIMKNDLTHLQDTVNELKKDVKECILPKIYKINERVAIIEGKLKNSMRKR